MRELNNWDWSVIVLYTVACFVVGFYFTKKANESSEDYFLGGRKMPWWLLGFSMAATNFSTDTPLAISRFIFKEGIAGVWFFWAAAIQVCLATFIFAQLWRRANVITDVQIVEKRYGGKPASALRLFKGIYYGVFFNSIIMAWVYKGLTKTLTVITTLNSTQVMVIFTLIVVIYTFASGFLGVVWTDLMQYVVAIFATFALMFFSLKEVGGLLSLNNQIIEKFGTGTGITALYPTWPQADQWMPLSVFFTYIGVQWWSHKFSDGGGKHIQRMSSARTERDAMFGSFLFMIFNFVIQLWPWIITILCGLVIFGRDLADPELAFPMMIARVMPHGYLGLLVVMAIAAFMSTISTHTNLGSSYLVNDLYRRFIKKDASDKHYLMASRIATLVTILFSILIAMQMESIGNTWKLLAEMTAGAGITWILRWFWWRINAWTELSAMISSTVITAILELGFPGQFLYSHKMWIIVSVSAVVWLTVTYMTSPVADEHLKEFVEEVRPVRFGWNHIYQKYNLTTDLRLRDNVVNCVVGLIFIFCFNFGVGNLLLQRTFAGSLQIVVAVVTFVFLFFRIRTVTRNQKQFVRT